MKWRGVIACVAHYLALVLLIRIGSLCYNTMEQPQVGDGVHLLELLNSLLSSHDGRGVVNGQQNLKGNFLMLLHHMHDWVETHY